MKARIIKKRVKKSNLFNSNILYDNLNSMGLLMSELAELLAQFSFDRKNTRNDLTRQ